MIPDKITEADKKKDQRIQLGIWAPRQDATFKPKTKRQKMAEALKKKKR